MSRTKRSSRETWKRQEPAVSLLAFGLLFVLLPWLLKGSSLEATLQPLQRLGWLLLAAGGVLLWFMQYRLGRAVPQPGAATASRTAVGASPAAHPTALPARPVTGLADLVKSLPEVPRRDAGRVVQHRLGRAMPRPEAATASRTATGALPAARPPVPSARPVAGLADLVKSLPEVPRRDAGRAGAAAQRPVAWGPEVFAAIEWRRFEAVVEALFAQAGFETRTQSHGADGGVDIWLHSRHQTDGRPVSLVQCKHWSGRPVGVDKVRELRGVMAAHDVRRGQFATTSSFTADAVAFGRANGINLLDVRGLLALIAQRTPEQQQALLEVALEGDYRRPTCVNCGVKMVERRPRNGGRPFWGCSGYPRCRTSMPMRQGV